MATTSKGDFPQTHSNLKFRISFENCIFVYLFSMLACLFVSLNECLQRRMSGRLSIQNITATTSRGDFLRTHSDLEFEFSFENYIGIQYIYQSLAMHVGQMCRNDYRCRIILHICHNFSKSIYNAFCYFP
jgi:hypothetical protein